MGRGGGWEELSFQAKKYVASYGKLQILSVIRQFSKK